jgi:hypothetical protein
MAAGLGVWRRALSVVLNLMPPPKYLPNVARHSALMYVQNMMTVDTLENHSGMKCLRLRA